MLWALSTISVNGGITNCDKEPGFTTYHNSYLLCESKAAIYRGECGPVDAPHQPVKTQKEKHGRLELSMLLLLITVQLSQALLNTNCSTTVKYKALI